MQAVVIVSIPFFLLTWISVGFTSKSGIARDASSAPIKKALLPYFQRQTSRLSIPISGMDFVEDRPVSNNCRFRSVSVGAQRAPIG